MKIKNRKKLSKKKLALLIACLLLLGSVGGYIAYSVNKTADNNKKLSTVEDNQVEDEEQPLVDDYEDSTNSSGKEKVLQPSASSRSAQNSLEKPNITRAEQTGDFIRVSAIFSQSSSGRCILKISKVGQPTIQKEVSIVVGPSYYACNGFRVPRTEIPSAGKWDIIVVHELNGEAVNSDRKTINVH